MEGYQLNSQERLTLSSRLSEIARGRLEGHVREAALTRMSRMKDKWVGWGGRVGSGGFIG